MHKPRFNVGGQAVIEGVMMRSPGALAIAVRKPNGEIAIKEAPWRSLASKIRFLTWPFFRGTVVLIESMVNGIDALTFSANQALDEEEDGQLSNWAMAGTIVLALGLAIGLFVVVPHWASLALGRWGPMSYDIASLSFHAVDGVIKLALFILYIWAISFVKDIGRVFEYHGAEHKTIYAYESGKELTVDAAKPFSTLHPRCGTAFIIVVLMLSILIFAVVFPMITPHRGSVGWGWQVFFVMIKILLMLPIAGTAYEINRYASKHQESPWLRWAILPGLWVQRLTTREPSDDQIEIAIEALKRALAIEAVQAG